MTPASITGRLTLLFALISSLVLLALGLLIGNSVERHFQEQDANVLKGRLHQISHLLEQVWTPEDLAGLPDRLRDSLHDDHGLEVSVQDSEGSSLFDSALAGVPLGLPLDQLQTWADQGKPWRGLAKLLSTGMAGAKPVRVTVAMNIAHHQQFMADFHRSLWLFILAATLISGLLGWVVVRRGLSPLQRIRQTTAEITANRLDYRLDPSELPDELAGLANTLNRMLARLQESFQRLNNFSTDLAHELRTPISNLMTVSQVALSQQRSLDEYREVLASNIEEYERMARMIGDMLFLAQADNGLAILNREQIDLAQQVRELIDYFDALADERQIRLEQSGSGSVQGDRLMLRRLLNNLLSNAIRHTPSAGRILVSIEESEKGTLLAVENTGTPIAKEHLGRIFDRFYRADPSRHRTDEGAGLGLAICKSIVSAHGGSIRALALVDGMRFEVWFVR